MGSGDTGNAQTHFYYERKRNSTTAHWQSDKRATATTTPLGGMARLANWLQTRQRVQTPAKLLHHHRHADAYLSRFGLRLLCRPLGSPPQTAKCIAKAYVLYSVGIQKQQQ